jgi:small GTP-binding protein
MAVQIPQLKLVLLGDESVGKTSLLNKWTRNQFDPNGPPTIGGAAQNRRDVIEGDNYMFQVWDTAGAEKFRALTPLYARDAKGAALVFDMTRKTSFDNLPGWVSFLRQQGQIPFVIMGNKEDIGEKLEVIAEAALSYAMSVGGQFFTTSAKTGANVELAFKSLEIEAVQYYRAEGPSEDQAMIEIDTREGEAKKGGCC